MAASRTRLDRLLALLESGTSAATRRAAAIQIGDIQKQYPFELPNLLLKVYPHLRSKSWDTRVAAAQAIEAIVSHVPLWDATRVKREGESKKEADGAKGEAEDEALLTFEGLDIDQVIEHGRLLLASGGQEFDESGFEGLEPHERIAAQRRQLMLRLGLGDISFIQDEDLLAAAPAPAQEDESRRKRNAELDAALEQKLSARERNRLKRKARQAERAAAAAAAVAEASEAAKRPKSCEKEKEKMVQTVATEQAGSQRLVLESVPVLEIGSLEELDEWPFWDFSARLQHDLFDAAWEVRHGAALGLREILKRHAAGAGRSADVSADAQAQANRRWLQDAALRLICVLALDRFADYVSDQTVAPVRETCAQALAAVARHMAELEDVARLVALLLRLLARPAWELRHAALLGLKYLAATRPDVVPRVLPDTLPALLHALQDAEDDVRALAADTLAPVVGLVRQLAPTYTQRLLDLVWASLARLDDLAASTASLLALLAELHALPDAPAPAAAPLGELVPRLFPFLRHSLKEVRASALHTLLRLLEAGTVQAWLGTVLAPLLRHVFQQLLLEEREELLEQLQAVWRRLVALADPQQLRAAALPHLEAWLRLLATPPGLPLDPALLIAPPFALSSSSEDTPASSGAGGQSGGESSGKRKRARSGKTEAGAEGHATPAKKSRSSPEQQQQQPQQQQQQQQQQQFSGVSTPEEQAAAVRMRLQGSRALGVLLRRWPAGQLDEVFAQLERLLQSRSALDRLVASLLLQEACADSPASGVENGLRGAVPESARSLLLRQLEEETPPVYSELERPAARVAAEARVLANSLQALGSGVAALPENAAVSLEAAVQLATSTYMEALSRLAGLAQSTRDQLEGRRRRVLASVGFYQAQQQALFISAQAAAAGAVVCFAQLPPKLNPVIRSLMNAVKALESEPLQRLAAASLARLVQLCLSREPCPNPKIASNLCTFLCAATRPNQSEEEAAALAVMRRGAQLALRALAHHFGGALFRDLPQLRDLMAGPLLAPPGTATAAARRDALLVLRTLVPALHRDLHTELLRLGPVLAELLRAGEEEVRTGAAQTFAALCRHVGAPAMEIFLRQALPLLARADEPNARIGAGEALQYLLEELGMEAAPYVSLLLLPALARMADQVPRVRELASRSFGALLRLAPLETGAGEPAGLSEELLLRHRAERRFVEQLLGGARLDDYEMPIAVRAELRRYQKEGVNWLAFLNRHGLHGILCDDMGLGKTLQALCILASDQLRRRERFEASGGRAAEDAPLPCLVVCPPTLVAHWALELQRFVPADVLQPLQYAGAPAERAQLRTRLRSRQADSLCVIMSYDILRNDIDHLDGLTFNYAVLDEGHLIRNPRAKISQAVKRVQARHRLILTGTPIQNSVLELWSLFDFLMPGFLGTEREFQEAYARPILASRDARAGAHELEAGHRALEALHRQVLPFILRRLKEEVLTDLPPKILQDIQCELSPLQVRLYEAFARRTRLRENLAAEMSADAAADGVTGAGEAKDGGKMGAKHVFQALQYLRKLCTHPALVLDPSHPDYEEIRRHLEASGSDLHSLAHAPKLQALRELLRQCGIGVAREGEEAESAGAAGAAQHRALVFCQMKGSLDLIEQDLLRPLMPDVSYLRLDGSVDAARRQQIVQQFNSDPTIDLLLLTTHVGGLGLNLTGADTVIFLEHDWNPQRDLQAMDRAHRIGQKRVVNVYRLITRGTLEEKIMSLQKFKLHIANQVVNVENASLQSMDLSQLLDLFNYSAAPAAPAAPAQQPAELDQFGALPEMPGKQKKKKKKTGLQAVLAELDELWDESQYAEEFNLDNFLRSLK